MNDEVETKEVSLREAQDTLSVMRALTESAGWSKLESVGKAKILAHTQNANGPATDVSSVLAQQYIKGVRDGIDAFLKLPAFICSDAEATITHLGPKIEDTSNDPASID